MARLNLHILQSLGRDYHKCDQVVQILLSGHMKRHVLIYGLIGGILIALLKWTEYRFLVIEHSFEIYGGWSRRPLPSSASGSVLSSHARSRSSW